jgi:3-mercaptopyruvate sulfurtransferase SseA
MLRAVGYKDVKILRGGFDAWLRDGYPVVEA